MTTVTRTPPAPSVEPVERRRFTADEFDAMAAAGIFHQDDRVELIEGDVIDMSPIGVAHARIVRRLNNLLARRLDDSILVDVQNPIRLNDLNQPQPDLALVHNRAYVESHPTAADIVLVIEVADSTLAYDRDVKLPLYARLGVSQVLLVDISNTTVTHYYEPRDDVYRQITLFRANDQFVLALSTDLQVELDVSDIFS
jgi:Uma2 family endonuclease